MGQVEGWHVGRHFHRVRIYLENTRLKINEEMHHKALVLIEDMSYLMCDSLLVRLDMPSLNRGISAASEGELQSERENDTNAFSQLVRRYISLLNTQPKIVRYGDESNL